MRPWIDSLWRDLRFAARRLRATPAFTVFAVVSLALGLGVTTAVYATIGSVSWNRPSSVDESRVVVLTKLEDRSSPYYGGAFRRPDLEFLSSRLRAASALAVAMPVLTTLDDGRVTSQFFATAVSGNYFSVTALPIAFGRGLEPADDAPGADRVVVLTDAFWRRRLAGDPSVIGRQVRIAGDLYLVVGVTSPSVRERTDLYGFVGFIHGDGWMSRSAVASSPQAAPFEDSLTLFTVLPRTSVPTFAADVADAGKELDRQRPLLRHQDSGAVQIPRRWSAATLTDIEYAQEQHFDRYLELSVVLVALVLLVATTNLANLMLSRGAVRRHEVATRMALGATYGRVIREQCAEGALIAIAGGVGAAIVAKTVTWLVTADLMMPFGQSFSLEPALDSGAAIAAALALASALVTFGVIPAWQLTRESLRNGMAGDAAGAAPGRWRGRRMLIAAQVAVSTTFLLMGAAALRPVIDEARHDPGIDLPHLAVGSIGLRAIQTSVDRAQPPKGEANDGVKSLNSSSLDTIIDSNAQNVKRALRALDAAVRGEAAFSSAALAQGLPVGSRSQFGFLSRVDASSRDAQVVVIAATPDIFSTLGVAIVRGRGFDDRDAAATPVPRDSDGPAATSSASKSAGATEPAVVLSARTARDLFGSIDVVGQVVHCQLPGAIAATCHVIGISSDTDTFAENQRNFGSVYTPLSPDVAATSSTILLVARTSGDPQTLLPLFERLAHRANPDLYVTFASTGSRLVGSLYLLLRGLALLAVGLAVLATTLAMVGLYGVLSHIVSRRTREIGIRVALGAETADVRSLVVRDGLRPVIWGLAFGLFAGTGARILMRFVEKEPSIARIDLLASAVAIVVLLVAGLAASYAPARRASNVDPNVALRHL